MDKSPKLTVVIPAYNEAQVITKVIEDLKERNKDYEIIVVDDGSTDNTYELARQTGVKVIHHSYNQGYGAALKTGIRNAETDFVCTMDADGQHRAEDVEKLFEEIKNDNYDVVIGARSKRSHISLVRVPGKKMLSIFANYLSGIRIPDLNSGLRVAKKESIMKLLHLLPDGFSFSTTITIAMYKMRYNVKWVPITTNKRVGKSSVHPLRHGYQTLLLIVRLVTLFDPLRIFLPVSIFLILVGSVYQVIVILFKGFHIVGGALLSILAGISIFFFGILADQISAIRREGIK